MDRREGEEVWTIRRLRKNRCAPCHSGRSEKPRSESIGPTRFLVACGSSDCQAWEVSRSLLAVGGMGRDRLNTCGDEGSWVALLQRIAKRL